MNKDFLKYRKEDLINLFITMYEKDNTPIPVDFRLLVSEINTQERYTHLIHTYPAKLLPQIPYFFLNNEILSKKGDLVLDPFCGTGTVLLEANLANRNSIGIDANPLARLISEVKVNYIAPDILSLKIKTIIDQAKLSRKRRMPRIKNLDFWFSNKAKLQLARLADKIALIDNIPERMFFEVCFSNLVKKVSYADPRISVPVKLNPERFANDIEIYKKIKEKLNSLNDVDVFAKFQQICQDNIKRISTLKDISSSIHSQIISDDARNITSNLGEKTKLKNESVDLIITSPPYAGAQKYIRSSSLSLGWLGFTEASDIRKLDMKNIGRENYYKKEMLAIKTGIEDADLLLQSLYEINKYERAYIVGNYINEMKDAIDESIRVLKKGGFLVMIIGNNKVCNLEFNTQEYLSKYIISKGLRLKFKLIDDIKSYGLMTKRNKTADIISREWVLVFNK